MARLKLLQLLSNVMTTILAMLVLFYHMSSLCKEYFSYKIKTNILIYLPDRLPEVSLTVCGRMTDLMDHQAVSRDLGFKWIPINENEVNETHSISASHFEDSLTIRQMMKYTPSTDSVVKSIRWRQSKSYRLYNASKNVMSSVNVTKLLYLDYICYTVSFLNKNNKKGWMAHRWHSLNSPVAEGERFRINFHEPFRKIKHAMFIMDHATKHPYRALVSNPEYHREHHNLNDIHVSRIYCSLSLLPPPYESWCSDYAPPFVTNEIDCKQKCLVEKTMGSLKLFPFTSVVHEENAKDIKRLSYSHTLNKTTSEKITLQEQQCERICYRPHCYIGRSLTIAKFHHGTHKMIVTVKTPHGPFVGVRAIPARPFIEFMTNVFSCLAVFLGISVRGLNPLLLVTKIRQLLPWTASRGQSVPDDLDTLGVMAYQREYRQLFLRADRLQSQTYLFKKHVSYLQLMLKRERLEYNVQHQ